MKLDTGDFETENLIVWEKIIRELFPAAIPNNCLWKDIDSIISILNKLSSVDNLNHTLFPACGGHDLTGAKKSKEKGCLGYNEKGVRVLLPKNARVVSRYFTGSFVIFAKSSPYNKNHVTYDARHDRMNSKKFRQYIEKCIIEFNE